MLPGTQIDSPDTQRSPHPSIVGSGGPGRSRRPRVPAILLVLAMLAAGAGLVAAAMTWPQQSAGLADPVTVSTGAGNAATTIAEVTSSATPASNLVDVSEIAGQVVDSVVTVHVTIDVRGPGSVTGSGSGIILDGDGTIITNAHVVDGATSVSITLADGTVLDASVVEVDAGQDLAVLDVDASGLSPISLGTTEGLEVGEPVIAVGNPLGLEGGPSVTTGIISALDRVLQESGVTLTGVIQTDAAITQGSSGGALLDAEGRLIGITTAVGVSSVGVEGIGFAIPVESIASVLGGLATT